MIVFMELIVSGGGSQQNKLKTDTKYSSLTSVVKGTTKELRGRRAEATLGMSSRGDIYPETQRKKGLVVGWNKKKKKKKQQPRRRLEQDELKRKTGVKLCMDL